MLVRCRRRGAGSLAHGAGAVGMAMCEWYRAEIILGHPRQRGEARPLVLCFTETDLIDDLAPS